MLVVNTVMGNDGGNGGDHRDFYCRVMVTVAFLIMGNSVEDRGFCYDG